MPRVGLDRSVLFFNLAKIWDERVDRLTHHYTTNPLYDSAKTLTFSCMTYRAKSGGIKIHRKKTRIARRRSGSEAIGHNFSSSSLNNDQYERSAIYPKKFRMP